MRITNEERKYRERLLRNGLPDYLRISRGPKAGRLALAIAMTLGLAPPSFAQPKATKTPPDLIMEKRADPNHYEVEYRLEDLQKEPPANPTVSLAQRLFSEVEGLLDRMWKTQKSGTERDRLDALLTQEPARDAYALHIAAMKDPPKIKYSDGNKILKQLSRNLQKVASDTTKNRIGLIDHFNAGLDFDLDLGETFWADDDSSANKRRGNLRYGLILQDIKVTKKGPDRAALDDDLSDLSYAGQADVMWTIGPLEDQEGQRIFNIKPAKPTTGDSLWDRVRIPEASFSGKMTPVNFGNLTDFKDEENLPGWRIELRQTENYYMLTHITDSKGKKQSEEHTFRIPVVGTMEIGRRFDDKFHVIQTSAYNILIDTRLPLLSFHYMNQEQRYIGSLRRVFSGHSLELSGSSEGTGSAPASVKKKDRPTYMSERYSLKYSTKF